MLTIAFANWYWTLWLLVGFGLYEGIAIGTGHPELTFTHFCGRVFALFPRYKGTRFWRTRRFAALAILSWLLLHMLSLTVGGLF
ncbi:MAG TPA: hypothetical protein VIV12_07775 [Streptosporangiaceae bacterium]